MKEVIESLKDAIVLAADRITQNSNGQQDEFSANAVCRLAASIYILSMVKESEPDEN